MMSFFDQVFKQLFAKPSTQPIKTPLKRSEAEKSAFQEWSTQAECQTLLQSVAQAYHLQKKNIESSPTVYLLHSPYANGIAIAHNKETMRAKSLQFLMEYFKEKTMALGYVVKNAERQMSDKNTHVEVLEKYYLKPSIKIALKNPEKSNQLYGNISLEHSWKDNQVNLLKILVTIYADRLFTEALSYEEYIDYLLARTS